MKRFLLVAALAFGLGSLAAWAVMNRSSSRVPARDWSADVTITHMNPAAQSPPPASLKPYMVQVDGERKRVGPEPTRLEPDDVWQITMDRGRVTVWCVATEKP